MEKLITENSKWVGKMAGFRRLKLAPAMKVELTRPRVRTKDARMLTWFETILGMEIYLEKGSVMKVNKGTVLLIRTGTKVYIRSGAKIVVEPGGYVYIEHKADLNLESKDSGFILKDGYIKGIPAELKKLVPMLKPEQPIPLARG